MTDGVPVALATGRPLTAMQRPLWLSQRRHPGEPVQNMALLTHIDGALDPERLATSFETVVSASDALRTRIVEDGGTARVRLDAVPQPHVVEQVRRDDAVDWAHRRARVPIDLRIRGYDSAVLVHEDDTVSWYLALHHAVTDATSSALVFASTARVYHGARADLPSYYRWAADPVHPRRRRSLDHWSARAPADAVHRLYRPARDAGTSAARLPVRLDDDVFRRLAGGDDADAMVSADLRWTTTLTTATAVLLRQVAGLDRCTIGLPVHNRNTPGARGLVGPVMEVFPVDVDIEPRDTLRSLHRRAGRAVLATLRNSAPGTAPAPDHATIVNVIPRAELGDFGPHATSTRWIPSGTIDSGHLLRVQLTAWDLADTGRPTLLLDVNRSAADPEHLSHVAEHVACILTSLVEDPDRLVDSSIVTAAEREQLRAWETTADSDRPIVPTTRLLRSALADRTDGSVRHGERTSSGADLWNRAVGTAAWLRRRGVVRGDRVGIEMARGEDAVIAILGTMLAGGSFVPLEPSEPAGRRRRLAAMAACRLVVTELPARGVTVPHQETLEEPDLDDEAYVIFTSGSSGEPKGVPITHRGLARYLRFAVDTYASGDGPVVAALHSSLGFDLTITSLFLPLLVGGELVVIGPDGPAGLAELAADRTITWCKATPSHLEILRRMLPADHGLRTLVVGGEAFGAALARRLLDVLPRLEIFNEYGPTEAVVGCMVHRVDPDRLAESADVPIGRPAPGVTLRIVGPELERVPIGAVGELCIAHPGLTAGYLGPLGPLGDEAATDVPPFDAGLDPPFVELDGVRFYRSGDLVHLADADTLVFVGRVDDQMKLGGIRLEPSEIEAAVESLPAVVRAVVRPWSPSPTPPERRCERCGLPSNVPGTTFDDDGVCNTCHEFDRVAPQARSWFGTRDDLLAHRDAARRRRRGSYDCLHLLSGGKDSTYALYQLVELGFEPLAFTLDNGYISEGAKANIARSVADLGVDHVWATTEAMPAILRDSLERYSDVCHGCYKALYTLATNHAAERGIPTIVTGLSRGQLFETRLIPQQFERRRFDPDAIDRAVVAARKTYHRADDGVNRVLDTSLFETDAVFEEIEYLDFYRYVDVELGEMLRFLSERAPWIRPQDTGRSTNCLINVAGIHAHLEEQGFHNYAVPYAWDVRLGHKTRREAIEELDDRIDVDEVRKLLQEVDYRPRPAQVLTAWVEVADGEELPSPTALRRALGDRLPSHAIPRAFVPVTELPLTANGKLDVDALPRPSRTHRVGAGPRVPPETVLEQAVIAAWERSLGVEPIGLDDEFFDLGGDSLAALQMIADLNATVDPRPDGGIRDEWAFEHPTPRALAAKIEAARTEAVATAPRRVPTPRTGVASDPRSSATPPLSDGELAVLSEHSRDPRSTRYNVAQLFVVPARIDGNRLGDALREVAGRHVPLSWSYGATRRELAASEAAVVDVRPTAVGASDLDPIVRRCHREPFDLEHGPLLRCLVQPLSDGSTAVLLVCHHVSIDEHGFGVLWRELDAVLRGERPTQPTVDYATYTRDLSAATRADDRAYWLEAFGDVVPSRLMLHPPSTVVDDGFVTRRARVRPDELRNLTGVTPFSAALTALVAALRRCSDGPTIEVGMIASIRDGPDADALVGFLLNTVPVALDCDDADELLGLARRATRLVDAHRAHRTYPTADIRRDRREHGRPLPGIDVALAFRDWRPATWDGAPVGQSAPSNGSSVTDATFFVELREDRVDLSLEHRGSVIDGAVAEHLLDAVDTMLESLVRRSDATVGDVELGGFERRLRGADLQSDDSLLPEILANVGRRGDRPAAVCADRTMTWRELGARSAAIATDLRAAGVEPGDRVVLELPRSVDVVAAVLAVLRVGAAYVPLDPAHPVHRRDRMIDLVAPSARIVPESTPPHPGEPVRVEPVDRPRRDTDGPADPPSATAYVMFTSGSTGRPRAVPVDHARLAASTFARRAAYARPPTRFLVVSSLGFDSSVAGIFWTLLEGGTIVLPTDDEVRDPDLLLDLITSQQVTDTLMVPTLYQVLLDRAPDHQPAWPRRVIVAGEASSRRLVDSHLDRWPDSELFNEYGPTETTVWATVHRCGRRPGPVPVGAPVPGTWVAVVDDHDRPLPPGVEGQLIVGGDGVVDGYLDDAVATSERFGADGRGRFFRTGDRAVVIGSEVLFLGRVDHQLNVGGARVEPEEVERVLLDDPTVNAAVVTGHDPRSLDDLVAAARPEDLAAAMRAAATTEDPATELRRRLREADPSGERLVAHLEPAHGCEVDLGSIARRVRDHLPAPIRPTAFAVHAALPRTAHGKLDRDATSRLPVVDPRSAARSTGRSRPDRTARHVRADELSEQLAARFARVLGLDHVDVDQSFFDLGGHSLLAFELAITIERDLDLDVDVATVYDHPTPAELARTLRRRPDRNETGAFLVPIQPDGDRVPIFGIHVLGIDAEFYRPLSRRLGDRQPVLGLGQPTANPDTTQPTDVVEIARRYAAEIEGCTPDGPVVLAAVSLGGIVAFELAQQLRSRGRDVALLVLFDAVGPDADRWAPTASERLSLHVAELRRDPAGYVADRARRVRTRAARRREILSLKVRRALGLRTGRALLVREFVERNWQSQADYRCAPYDGAILAFKAGDDPFTASLARHGLGWQSVARGPLDVVTIPGDHLSILAEPAVARTARELEAAIAAATSSVDRHVGRATIERDLVAALDRGRFGTAVATWLTGDRPLTSEASELLERCDRVAQAIATDARRRGEHIVASLDRVGIRVRLAPVPERAQFGRATVWMVEQNPDESAVARVVAEIERLGHRVEGGGRATGAGHRGPIQLISADDPTFRVALGWSGRSGFAVDDPVAAGSVPTGSHLATPIGLVDRILHLVRPAPDDVVLDLGCGDGRVLIAAATGYGCRGRGVEADPAQAARARTRVDAAGLTGRILIEGGDVAGARVEDAAVVFLFLPAAAACELIPGVLARLPPGGRLVAHEQLSPAWPVAPDRSTLLVEDGITVAHVWQKA